MYKKGDKLKILCKSRLGGRDFTGKIFEFVCYQDDKIEVQTETEGLYWYDPSEVELVTSQRLEIGKYYNIDSVGGFHYKVKVLSIDCNKNYVCDSVDWKNFFRAKNALCTDKQIQDFRELTWKEIVHLEKCIAAGKYIEPSESIDYSTWSKEKLLEKAKNDYPIGTKYRDINDKHEFIIESISWPDSNFNDIIWAERGKGYLYHKGVWAEIVSKPEIKITLDDLEKDKYYAYRRVNNPDKWNIFKSKGKTYYIGSICYAISNLIYEYYSNSSFYPCIGQPNEIIEYRVATQEEINWLDLCISANKFVEKPIKSNQEEVIVPQDFMNQYSNTSEIVIRDIKKVKTSVNIKITDAIPLTLNLPKVERKLVKVIKLTNYSIVI